MTVTLRINSYICSLVCKSKSQINIYNYKIENG